MKLTLPQQDVYFEQLLYPNDPIYNIGAKIEIKGPLSVELLKAAYVALIDQHDAYRAVFHQKGEAVEMHIQETHQTSLGFVDFSAHQNPEHVAEDFMQKTFLECFDLLGGELLHRFTLVKVREDFHYLFSVYHHIITDGWGTSLMFQRLVKNYNELVESGAIASSYPFSYQTFVAEDQAYHQSDTFQHDKAYWVEKFKHLPDNLFEKIEGGDALHRSRRAVLMIPRQRYNQMNELASRYRVSSFHLILACLYLYFGRKQQNHDFAIGLPVLNRSKRIYKQTVGLFMGISPLRMQLDMEARFEDLLISIKRQLRQDYRHQRFPLGKLIQELQVFGEKEKLFNITLSYEKQDYSHKFDQTQTRVIPMTHQSERVALALYIREFDASEDVKIDFDYNLNYFDADSIDQVVMHFEHLLKEVLANPERRLREFEYLPSAQRSKLLEGFNQTARRLPTDQTLLDLFESEVQERPHEVAAMDDAQILTYAELDLLSRRVASYLLATFGEEDRSPIALLLDRSVNTLAILLGIFRAGRSYIPLDPNFPQERLNYIVENSQTNLLIREKDYQLVGMEHLIVVELENMLREISLLDGSLLGRVSPEDTAYIIYTSGSTGQPKGVEIGHRSLLNFLLSMQRQPGMSAKDVLFSVTTYSFDISILEFFTPLISGAAVYIANQKVLSDPSLTIQKLQDVSPSILQATPSFY
ncbi:MAG: condensation domain-containing protein, partial [Bacteroidota bacterium]